MTGATTLVTGANGFVGSSVVRALHARGEQVIALVRRGRAGDQSCLIREIDGWSLRELEGALEGIRCVVHAASVVHRPATPLGEYERFNIEGTRTLVDACVNRGVHRIVLLSTIKVYGETPPCLIDETTPTAPEAGYASSKLTAERIVLDAEGQSRSAVVLRLCPVFGRGDKGNVRTMIDAVAHRRFLLPGDGSTRKSIVHVSTVADVVAAAIRSDRAGIFVVSDRETPSMRELGDAIAAALHRQRPVGVPLPLLMTAAGAIELLSRVRGRSSRIGRDLIRKAVTPTVCSPARVERELQVRCHVDLASAIREEVEWLRSEQLL